MRRLMWGGVVAAGLSGTSHGTAMSSVRFWRCSDNAEEPSKRWKALSAWMSRQHGSTGMGLTSPVRKLVRLSRMIYGEVGTYRYFSDPTRTIRAAEQLGDMLVGYGVSGETYSLNILLEQMSMIRSSLATENSVQGRNSGKIRAEFWAQPTSWACFRRSRLFDGVSKIPCSRPAWIRNIQ
jgi:hypothetical protein